MQKLIHWPVQSHSVSKFEKFYLFLSICVGFIAVTVQN